MIFGVHNYDVAKGFSATNTGPSQLIKIRVSCLDIFVIMLFYLRFELAVPQTFD